jgi:tetratricopeptide (TPR) repeat protein
MKNQFAAIALIIAAPAFAAQRGALDLYNEGVGALRRGELRDAESTLRDAVQTNHPSVQPLALYNLGHVRFQQGKETLKGEGNRQQLLESAEAASAVAQEAIRSSQEALKGGTLEEIIGAYMEARSARKQLRISRDDTTRAMDLQGSALWRWRRSVGDFHSAQELDPSNKDASFNADVVERHIKELLKSLDKVKEQNESLSEQRQKLGELMKEMRGKIPKSMQRQGDSEEDEEDEEDEKQPDGQKEEEENQKPPKAGSKQEQRIGVERPVSEDMAKLLKEILKRRTMQLGDKEDGLRPGEKKGMNGLIFGDETRKPEQRKGRNW